MAKTRPTSTKRQREFDKRRKKQEKLEKKKKKEIEKEKTFSNIDSYRNNIGKQVISLDFGVGIISSIETLDSNNNEEYYVVESSSNKLKIFFPIENNRDLRFVTSRVNLLKIFESLKEIPNMCKMFESKKERLEYFKSSLKLNNLKLITKRIIELSNIDDLSTIERKILDKLIKSLELEVFIVLNFKSNYPKDNILNYIQYLTASYT